MMTVYKMVQKLQQQQQCGCCFCKTNCHS